MKKWLIGAVCSIIIIPALAMSWKNAQLVWAAPEKVTSIENKLQKQAETQEQLSQLAFEQKARMDKQEAISSLQIEALKEQLSIVSELKKRK